MKHSVPVTLTLLLIFVLAQFYGLFVVSEYIDIKESAKTGKTVPKDEMYANSNITPVLVENESFSWIYLVIPVFLGTLAVLLLIKFKQGNLWKFWFFFSVVLTLILALIPLFAKIFRTIPFISDHLYSTTVLIAVLLAYFKVFKNQVFIHNFTEIFIYGGLAALLVPLFNVLAITVALLLFALYDMYAVWKSKHMIAMAQFQTEQKVFAGLYIPYSIEKKQEQPVPVASEKLKSMKTSKKSAPQTKTMNTAILGGGDVAFPLLFSGVLLKTTGGFAAPVITTITTTIALALLFYFGEKGKFYPAIPFIAGGCFVGYGLYLLI